jgi:type IV secretory pathway protease TraF
MQVVLASNDGKRNQEASVQLAAVDAEKIDLVLAVRRAHVSGWRETRRSCPHHDDAPITVQPPPLALHAPDAPGYVERQVDPAVLGHRPQQSHSEPGGMKHDRQLGNRTLVVGVHNRNESDDSRFWGPVPKAWIIGKVTT